MDQDTRDSLNRPATEDELRYFQKLVLDLDAMKLSLTPEDPATSIYAPLDNLRKEIRLLTLLPSPAGFVDYPLGLMSRLRCTLQVVSLLDSPVYDCISYRWGDPNETTDVTVNGNEMPITRSLDSALRQFRCDAGREEPMKLWADAICINQNDIEEQNQQVALMRDVYAQAANVRIWLGPAVSVTDEIALGYELLRNIGTDGRKAPMEVKRWLIEPILGLGKLFENPYWTRRWITQEIALARALTIHQGPVIRPFSVEEELVNLQLFGLQILKMYGETSPQMNMWQSVGQPDPDNPTWREWQDIFESTKTLQSAIAPIISARSIVKSGKLSATLEHIRGAKCSVTHDYVYAILGMLPSSGRLRADYSKSWEVAFAEFTSLAMDGMQNGSLLYFAPSSEVTLPSWTLDWRFERDYDDDLLGVQDMYNAAAGSPFISSTPGPGAIKLRGHLVETVKAVGVSAGGSHLADQGTAANTNRLLLNWIHLYNQHCRKDHAAAKADEIDDALLRTLLADIGRSWTVATRGQLLKGLPQRLRPFEARRYKREVDRYLRKEPWDYKTYSNLDNRISRYTFFVTSDGRPGLAKPGVQVGDHICIFAGCYVPYCIRAEEEAGMSSVYSLVSPCYVDGIMDGEAILTACGVAETFSTDVRDADIFDDVILI